MLKTMLVLCVVGLTAAGCATCPAKSEAEVAARNARDGAPRAITDADPTQPCLRHVVLFKWKDGTPPATVNEIEQAFAALPGEIPQISAFEWGTDVSVENLSQGFTHCFLLSFKSEEDLAVYLPHPAHKAFVELIGPHLDKVLVVDYWAQR